MTPHQTITIKFQATSINDGTKEEKQVDAPPLYVRFAFNTEADFTQEHVGHVIDFALGDLGEYLRTKGRLTPQHKEAEDYNRLVHSLATHVKEQLAPEEAQ